MKKHKKINDCNPNAPHRHGWEIYHKIKDEWLRGINGTFIYMFTYKYINQNDHLDYSNTIGNIYDLIPAGIIEDE